MILSPVDSAHFLWPRIEASLNRVIEKTGERWTPSYVLKQIQEGKAGLFRFHEDGKHIAYLLCERLEGYEVTLNLWVLEGDGLSRARIREGVRLIDGLAKAVGASAVKLTGRGGWERALRGYFKPVATVYERRL